jgi:hypothetical protein
MLLNRYCRSSAFPHPRNRHIENIIKEIAPNKDGKERKGKERKGKERKGKEKKERKKLDSIEGQI